MSAVRTCAQVIGGQTVNLVRWDQALDAWTGPGVLVEAADAPAWAPPDVTVTNGQTIVQAAANALVSNRTYLAIATPTTAQAVTQVRALTQQVQGLIHLAIGDLSGTT